MILVRRSARAEEDLIEIWSYIAQQNSRAADQLLDRLQQRWELLATHLVQGWLATISGQESGMWRRGSILRSIVPLRTGSRLSASFTAVATSRPMISNLEDR
jgi:plasmid stabilization system protein ParE